jgi:molybdate transport repressor ModE-like protein
MAIELKHLRVLAAIQRTGTISAAARELGYSQPAISQQVAHAERTLKTPLLHRARSGANLTEAGEILVRLSATVLPQISQALSEIDAIAGLRSGTIRIAAFPSAAAMLIPDALAAIRATHPGLQFLVTEREPLQAIKALRAGECDIALIYEYSSALTDDESLALLPEETGFTIAKESIKVALPPGHPLSAERVVELGDLAAESWIASCSEGRSHVVDLCEAVGFTPHIAFETHNHVAVQRLVAAALGVALLPELVAVAGGSTQELHLLPCSPASFRTARAITTKTLLSVPGVPVTVDALRDAVSSNL